MTRSLAVIGSGIGGLAAAYRCCQAGWKVTLFEKQRDYGMVAQGLKVDGGQVDVPLWVMGSQAWPSVLALAEEVNVDTFPVDVHSSCSWLNQQTWFRSGRLFQWPAPGSWRFLNGAAVRVGLGLIHLARLTRQARTRGSQITLGQLLKETPVDPLFWRGLILPIMKTICTCQERQLLQWPASQLLELLHGIVHSDNLVRLHGGTDALADALVRGIDSYRGSPVKRVQLNRQSISVQNERGEGGRFDQVIVATQANQLDFLADGPFAAERAVLEGINYAQGELLVHQDECFMPARQRDWTALNFQMDESLTRSMFTVWVNAVEPSLAGKAPVFQTWDPLIDPNPDRVLARIPMQRAVVTTRTYGILRQVQQWQSQPDRRLFYCGSWAAPGVPLLETAVQSAQAVVATILNQD